METRQTSAICQRIASDVKLGEDVKIHSFVNLYGCEIGGRTKIMKRELMRYTKYIGGIDHKSANQASEHFNRSFVIN